MTMYSTADIAKILGCTTQNVNIYRRKVEEEISEKLGKPDPEDRRRTLFSEDEFQLIRDQAPRIPVHEPDVLEGEFVDGDDQYSTVPLQRSSLSLRHPSVAPVVFQTFDQNQADREVQAIQSHTDAIAKRADSVLSQFAMHQMQHAVADIERTIQTLKANALGDAAAQLGKPTAGEKSSD